MIKMKEITDLHQSHKSSFLSEKKFLHHFETINTPTKNTITKILSSQTPSKNYASKIQSYSTNMSLIDNIIATQTQYHPSTSLVSQQQFVRRPMLVNLHPKVKQNVEKTIQFFHPKSDQEKTNLVESPLDLSKYIATLNKIELKKKVMEEDSHIFERTSEMQFKETPVIDIKEVKEVKEEGRAESAKVTERNQRMKKIDLLLTEIMREKKRKGLVSDYFHVMKMKLVELLQYIIEDEKQYSGLGLSEKIQQVLKNIETFRGKKIDGQLKLNMLRFFFEELHSLKREKQEFQKQQSKNKLMVENRQQKRKKSTMIEMSDKQKNKKNMETMSMGGKRKEVVNKGAKSMIKKEEQWIGSLQ